MANYSTGGFICLPGGYGTFEEMMEMITWNQVCRLRKLDQDYGQLTYSLVFTVCPSWF